MDSTHAAPGKARRWAAVSAFLAGALAMWLSSAHADECTVEERVLRDGIVSLPLVSAPPPAPLDLTSLGTIVDPAQNLTFSVWRVVNSGTTSYRANLEAPGGERVPLLVSAGTEVTLRSDSLGTGNHSLIVDNATVDQAAIAATTFADPRELADAQCMFDGNPLYAGEHAGTLKISTVHGTVVAEIPGSLDLDAIATTQPEGKLLTLRGNSLRMFDWAGSEIANVTLPSTATAGAPGRQRVAADTGLDDIWVAVGATLYHLSAAGEITGSVTYPEAIQEINLGARRRLWVALESDVYVVERDNDVPSTIAEVAHISLPAAVTAITHDTYWTETRIVAGSTLFKYELNGILLESVPLAVSAPIRQLAADGTGGAWVSTVDRLFRLQADGSVAIEIEAFAGGASIVDLAGDPADGTAWVTSGSRIRHFGRDGALLHDLLPNAAGGGTRQFRFLELFSDRTSPYVRMTSPPQGSTVTTARPTLEIQYNDPAGRGVATDTLEILTDDEQPLPVDCDAGPYSASCTPTVDLPNGEIVLWPRAYDLAGNLSGPRPHGFTVQSEDTGPVPHVMVNTAYDGMVTNVSWLTVRGEVENATGLTLNGDPVPILSGYWFYRDVELVEGPNLLRLIAVNGSGASAQLDITVVLDTIVPSLPDLSLIQVTIDEETGQLRVSAPAGTFEPFARVNIYNGTSAPTQIVANADGSLSATVNAEPGDQLTLWVGDEAGNEGEQVSLPYTLDQVSVTITSSSPATVTLRDLVVRGMFTGPADASITANGIVAAVSGSGNVRNFAVRVPLAAGQNTVQVVAVAPGRPQVAQSVVVTREGDDPFRIDAGVTDGPAPLEVAFTVQRFDATRIQRVEVDYEGDGVIDLVDEASRIGTLVHEYLVPGNYTATFQIYTTANTLFTYQVPVLVYPAAERDVAIQVTWQKFRTALGAGNAAAALEFMLPSAAEHYSPVFTALQSSLPQIVGSFSAIYPTNAVGIAEYVMTREVNGQPMAFLVYFARGSDGVWRIASL